MPRAALFIGTIVLAALLYAGARQDRNAGAALASTDGTPASQITIVDDSFKPAAVTVTVGSKVTWTNHDDDPHTVTSVQPLFDSKGLAQGDTYSFVFHKPGTYAYYCKVHPFMKATIVVKGTQP